MLQNAASQLGYSVCLENFHRKIENLKITPDAPKNKTRTHPNDNDGTIQIWVKEIQTWRSIMGHPEIMKIMETLSTMHIDLRLTVGVSISLNLQEKFSYRTNIETNEPPRGKTNNVVSEQVRHKPACTSTEKS